MDSNWRNSATYPSNSRPSPNNPTIFGYTFANGELLTEALTTPSCKMQFPNVRDNQRLEFLGDAVLGLLSAERVYAELPREEEGSLTVHRTHMVSTAALAAAAKRLSLDQRLQLCRGAPKPAAGSKTYADAIEAIIGAAYLDGGFEAARTIFAALQLEANAEQNSWSVNPKGELQMRAQAMKPPQHPQYLLLKTEGKAHEPLFTVQVEVAGMGKATASAHSRKEAESIAAAKLLKGENEEA